MRTRPVSVADIGSSAAPLDDLALVLVVLEQLEGAALGDLVADERLALGDDLAHPGVDAVEVVGGERAAVGQLEVVVEAVLDRRADGEGGAREQVEHRLGQHVGRRVADREEAPVVGLGDDGGVVAVVEGPDQVALGAVDRRR